MIFQPPTMINCNPFIRLLSALFAALALLSVSGCITHDAIQSKPQPLPPEKVDWVAHVRALTLLTDWKIAGKIGVKQQDEGGSAYIDWTQSQDSFHIRLSGPLGQGTTILSGNESGAKLESASDGTFIAESPEELLYQHTGWHIPLHYLLYWVKGLPEPRVPAAASYDQKGYIESLTQGPWKLQFYKYRQALGVTLPHKIKIQTDDLKVTLVIKHWDSLEES